MPHPVPAPAIAAAEKDLRKVWSEHPGPTDFSPQEYRAELLKWQRAEARAQKDLAAARQARLAAERDGPLPTARPAPAVHRPQRTGRRPGGLGAAQRPTFARSELSATLVKAFPEASFDLRITNSRKILRNVPPERASELLTQRRADGLRLSTRSPVVGIPVQPAHVAELPSAFHQPRLLTRNPNGATIAWYVVEPAQDQTLASAKRELRAIASLELGIAAPTRTPFALPSASAEVIARATEMSAPAPRRAHALSDAVRKELSVAGVVPPSALRAAGMDAVLADRTFAKSAIRAGVEKSHVLDVLAIDGARRTSAPQARLRWATRQLAVAIADVQRVPVAQAVELAAGVALQATGIAIKITRRAIRLIRAFHNLTPSR